MISTNKCSGRYSVFIEPIFHLGEIYFQVSIFDTVEENYITEYICEEYHDIIKYTKFLTKEIMNK